MIKNGIYCNLNAYSGCSQKTLHVVEENKYLCYIHIYFTVITVKLDVCKYSTHKKVYLLHYRVLYVRYNDLATNIYFKWQFHCSS